ncbi:SRPBCC family protein [Cellulomonas telluris]|uniref:SRPBCC family protein n=1 Tax=Cellulomonas telluris TaxID=2306636 RepID=UPI0010A90295|nr:SRPBCC family protein [Cellulomonas telluris]
MTTPTARPAGPAAPDGIAGASVTRTVDAPARLVFAALTDARNHGRWVPQTRVRTDGAPTVGTRVEAVSGPLARFGAPGLVDRMRITAYDPPTGDDPHAAPGVAVFRKDGPVLLGTATIVVEPLGGGRCRATFREHVTLAGPLPGALTSRLTAPGFDVMLRVVLRRAARELEG